MQAQRLQRTIPKLALFLLAGLGLASCVSKQPLPPEPEFPADASNPAELDEVRILHSDDSDRVDALAHFSRGLSEEIGGNSRRATEHYLTAIERDPDNNTLYFLASKRYMAEGLSKEAIELIQRLIEHKGPDSADAMPAYTWKAILHRSLGQQQEAIDCFVQAASVVPDREDLYLEAARGSLNLGEFAQAEAILRQSIDRASTTLRSARTLSELMLRRWNLAQSGEPRDALLSEVLALLERFSAKHPNELYFRLRAASVHGVRGDFPAMMKQYRLLDASTPDDMKVRGEIANHLMEASGAKSLAAAQHNLGVYLKSNPEDGLAYYLSGQYFEFADDSESALAAYEQATRFLPDEASPMWKCCIMLMQLERHAEARHRMRKAMDEHPENLDLRRLAANYFLTTGDYATALPLFEEIVVQLDRGTSIRVPYHFHASYARCLQALGKRTLAVRSLSTAAMLDPRALEMFWDSEWRRSLMAEDQAASDAVLQDLEDTLLDTANRLPDLPMTNSVLAHHFAAIEDYERSIEALDSLRDMVRHRSDSHLFLDAEYYFDLGAAHERAGNIEKAEVYLEQAIALDEKHARAYNYLAYTWAEHNMKLEKAMEYVNKALVEEPDNGAYVDTRGWVYYRMGRYEEALADLLRAADLYRTDSIILEHVGDVLLKLERNLEAAGFFKIAMELGPDVPERVRSKIDEAMELHFLAAKRDEVANNP